MSQDKNARDAILDAAVEIVRESGAAHLTYDAMSARCGVSKGGVLYHFPTKEALLLAMVERLREVFVDVRNAEAAKLPAGRTRNLKAYIRSAGFLQQDRLRGIAAAILAAGAHDPRLLAPVKDARDALIEELSASGLRSSLSEMIVLTIEGLWMLEALGIKGPDDSSRQAIIQELLRLVDEEDARSSARGDGEDARTLAVKTAEEITR